MSVLESMKEGRRKHGLRRYLNRQVRKTFDRLFYSLTHRELVSVLRDVGVQEGTSVCVHSSLSSLGHVDGGVDTVIGALQEAVGSDGRLLMPANSLLIDMATHIEKSEVFDVRRSPSHVGLIPEMFRRREGVLRSCHPTNSVAGWGRDVQSLLSGHENSSTPFGHDTPYGRLATRDDAYILMIDTHLMSVLHHLQERVDFPNLFLPDEAQLTTVGYDGTPRVVTTKVMRSRVPYFVAIPPASGDEPDWAIIHDYALMFPGRRETEAKRLGYQFDGFPLLHRRRSEFESAGILKTKKLHRGEIGLLHLKPFLEIIQPELEDLIERYRPYYDADRIAAMKLPYS